MLSLLPVYQVKVLSKISNPLMCPKIDLLIHKMINIYSRNGDCQPGLVCGRDNCKDFHPRAGRFFDCCTQKINPAPASKTISVDYTKEI